MSSKRDSGGTSTIDAPIDESRGRRGADEEEQDDTPSVFGQTVELPLKSDGGIIAILPSQEVPTNEVDIFPGRVIYGRLEDVLPKQTRKEWLDTMIKHPNLAVLRKLLAGVKLKHPQPAQLLSDEERFSPGGSANSLIDCGDDQFAIFMARVQPVNGAPLQADELPQCAYVFDMQGDLLAALWRLKRGLGKTRTGDRVGLRNMGPGEDWFVEVNRC